MRRELFSHSAPPVESMVVTMVLIGMLIGAPVGTALAQQAAAQPSQLAGTADQEQPEGPVLDMANPFPRNPPPSTHVRVTVLDPSKDMMHGTRVLILLDRYRRRELETRIGMQLEMANLSRLSEAQHEGNIVFYRPGFLRAAMLIAREIPGAQDVQPMGTETLAKSGIDVQIVLGGKAS